MAIAQAAGAAGPSLGPGRSAGREPGATTDQGGCARHGPPGFEAQHHSSAPSNPAAAAAAPQTTCRDPSAFQLTAYGSELQLPEMMEMIQHELSEPYSVYTYRYFLHNWPELCFVMRDGPWCVGTVICKLDTHGSRTLRGYIAMLVVDKAYRKRGIGSRLAEHAISRMRDLGAEEIVLETEVTNKGALALYENLGFVRDKRLYRYYLNGEDAFRLKLWFAPPGVQVA